MKQFLVFVTKEFRHVIRDRKTLLILFGMPVAQILLFGFVLTNEIKDSQLVIVDHAKDVASQAITEKLKASKYFRIEKTLLTSKQMQESFKSGNVKAAVVFPVNFYIDLLHTNKAQIQILSDASDPNTATLITNYINAIIADYQQQLNLSQSMPYQIIVQQRMIYNPQLLGIHNFVPGVIALVLMLVCVMMTAISIVKEKETGTMEVLLVSPFQPLLVILSKAIPYLVLSLINLVAILLLSVYVLGLPVQGSILLLLAESTLFIICCLTLGILISIKTSSQQAAMLISLVGMFLPTVLFSGFMFPIENMPRPLQVFSCIVPSRWFYYILKCIMIKGLGITAIWKETLILLGTTLILLGISFKNFKIRLD